MCEASEVTYEKRHKLSKHQGHETRYRLSYITLTTEIMTSPRRAVEMRASPAPSALLGDGATLCQCPACAVDFGLEIPHPGVCGDRRAAMHTPRKTRQRLSRLRLLVAILCPPPVGWVLTPPRLPWGGRAVPGEQRAWGSGGPGTKPLALPAFFLLSGTCPRGPVIQQPLCDLEDGSHTPRIRETQRARDPSVTQSPTPALLFPPASVLLDTREKPGHDLCRSA